MEDFLRNVIAPLALLAAGFLLEHLANRVKGKKEQSKKFKAWMLVEENLNYKSPCDIEDIKEYARRRKEDLIDLSELSSFEDYAGLSFDLCIGSFTTDVLTLYSISGDRWPDVQANIAVVLAVHFLLTVFIVSLVMSNNCSSPFLEQAISRDILRGVIRGDRASKWKVRLILVLNWLGRSRADLQTVLAVFLGLLALVLGLWVLWSVL